MEQEMKEWSLDEDCISDQVKAENRKEEKLEEGGRKEEEKEISIEKILESEEVPSWREQLTMRGYAVTFVLSVLFTFIVMKIDLTTGIVPSLNPSAGLLCFFLVSVWTKFAEASGLLKQPFTRQENTVILTGVVASSGIAFSGGFGSYLLGMSEVIAKQSENAGDNQEYKNPAIAWMIGFLFVVSFRGLFTLLLLRKTMIIDLKLTYPSGTATAFLINSFHTPQGAKFAKKQIRALRKFFSFSFLWGFFQWFFAAGDNCGFASFPTFGLKAYKYRFYFDCSATYVGVGMICPQIVNISLLLGGILSWGLMWLLIEKRKGDWYPAELPPNDIRSLQGYKIFITMSMILGDALYNFFKVLGQTLLGLCYQFGHKYLRGVLPIKHPLHLIPQSSPVSYNEQRRTQFFLKEPIPTSFILGGYMAIAAISTITLPHILPQLKWYYVMVIYMFSPVMAFADSYGCGLSDWSFASNYGKLAIFAIGAWAGAAHNGVITGLAACGVMLNIVSTASDLMQNLKTGYLTLASPRSMFVSQMIGTAMGCLISPCVFWLFYRSFDGLGHNGSEYPAPYAYVYRNMAMHSVEGISNLPNNCLILSCVFFSAAILINLVRDIIDKKRAQFIPIPMAMAMPFYLGPFFAIDMCAGSLIMFAWQRINKAKADAFGTAVASGLICGDGIWNSLSSILALAGAKQPICMKFRSWATNAKVDKFLGS